MRGNLGNGQKKTLFVTEIILKLKQCNVGDDISGGAEPAAGKLKR